MVIVVPSAFFMNINTSYFIAFCLLSAQVVVQIVIFSLSTKPDQANEPFRCYRRLNKSYCNIFQNPQNYELTNVNFDNISTVSSPGKINFQARPRASCLSDIGRRFLISSLQWSDIKELRNSEGEVYKFLMNVGKTCTK